MDEKRLKYFDEVKEIFTKKGFWNVKFLDFDNCRKQKRKLVILVSGLKCLNNFRLGPISLKKFTWKKYYKFLPDIYFEAHAVLEIEVCGMKNDGPDPLVFFLHNLIYAIAVVTDGDVRFSQVYTVDNSFRIVESWPYIETSRLGVPDGLALNNIEEFKRNIIKIFNVFATDPYGTSLTSAIIRYVNAGLENKIECVIDYVIALEGILGYGLTPADSISHRISVRGACLLNPKKKRLYYEAIKILYSVRSDKVHGEHGIYKMKEKHKETFKDIGYYNEKLSDTVMLANFARSITRKLILMAINKKFHFDDNWLINLELAVN